MEPQFIINEGCLDIFKLSAKDFLEMLNVDLKKAVPSNEDFNCPKCDRTKEDAYFIYHRYQDFKFGTDSSGGECDYSFARINYFLCICGCLYYTGTEAKHISCKKIKIKENNKGGHA